LYEGPKLTKATIDNVDILEKIEKIYGEERNWGKQSYYISDVFDESVIGKSMYLEFENNIRKDTNKDWYQLKIRDMNEILNFPLGLPFNLKK
jgi:hypothetical protein